MNAWLFYLGWYQGAIYSNLFASGICAGLVYWRARIHLRRHRDSINQRLDAHAQQHANTHELLESLHEHLTAPETPESKP